MCIRDSLDDIEQKDISSFENKIIEKCKAEKPEIIEGITTSGKLDDEHEKILNEIILQLKKDFSA